MKICEDEILKGGWTIRKSVLGAANEPSIELRAERKFALLWPRLNDGLRWMVLDLLRRYTDALEACDDLNEAPSWARFNLTYPGGIINSGSGDFMLRLKLPNKSRKTKPFIQLTFVNNASGFSCWPPIMTPQVASRPTTITIAELIACPYVIDPNLPKRRKLDYTLDPVARPLIDLIPDDIRDEVLAAVIENRVSYHLTNSTGEAGQIHPPVLGIEAMSFRDGDKIVAIGYLADNIYFQKGWLMVKLAKLPRSLHTQIDKGYKAEDMFYVSFPDGRGGTLRPFKDLIAIKSMTGETWMGKHVQLKFEPIAKS